MIKDDSILKSLTIMPTQTPFTDGFHQFFLLYVELSAMDSAQVRGNLENPNKEGKKHFPNAAGADETDTIIVQGCVCLGFGS